MNHKYFIILGDVRDSRKSIHRSLLQKNLTQTMEAINQNDQFSQFFVAPFSIVKGVDEIGAVLTSVKYLYPIMAKIGNDIFPEIMRFSINYNKLDIGIKSHDIKMMDGPAFHQANQQMEEMKIREKLKSRKFVTINFNGKYPRNLELMYESLINTVFWIKNTWKKDDFEIYTFYKQQNLSLTDNNKKKTMKELGQSLEKERTQQGISKRYVHHGIGLVLEMEKNLEIDFDSII